MDGYEVGVVSLDGFAAVVGQWDPRARWNGFLCPWFDAWTVERILAAIAIADEVEGVAEIVKRRHEWEDGVLVYTATYGGEEFVDRVEPDADGLYDLGAYGWVWTEDVVESLEDTEALLSGEGV